MLLTHLYIFAMQFNQGKVNMIISCSYRLHQNRDGKPDGYGYGRGSGYGSYGAGRGAGYGVYGAGYGSGYGGNGYNNGYNNGYY